MAPNNSKLRNWCLTINNPKYDGEHDPLLNRYFLVGTEEHYDGKLRYAVWQLERGDGQGVGLGTKHLQAYLEFNSPILFSKMKTWFPDAHIEPRQGSAVQARDYCMKEDTRIKGPYEQGDFGGTQGHRSDLHLVAERIASGDQISTIAMEHPLSWMRYGRGMTSLSTFYRRRTPNDEIHIRVLWGDTRSGKTSQVYKDYPNCYAQSDKGWFDGYMGEETLFFDDFDPECFSLKLILKICDRFPLMVPTKGGHVVSNWKTVVFTSNEHPREWYIDPKGAFKARLDESEDVVKWLNPRTTPVLRVLNPSDSSYKPLTVLEWEANAKKAIKRQKLVDGTERK